MFHMKHSTKVSGGIMKKYLLSLSVLFFSVAANAEVLTYHLKEGTVNVELNYELQQGFYHIKGCIDVLDGSGFSCDFGGYVAEYGNGVQDGISKACGQYIIKVDSVIEQNVPKQGKSALRIKAELIRYSSREYAPVGNQYIDLKYFNTSPVKQAKDVRSIDRR